MIYKDDLKKLYFSVRDDNKELTQKEIECLSQVGLKEYDEDTFSKTIFCLAFGSKFFENNPKYLDKVIEWGVDDYDLGQIFDAIKYADLTKNYLELLFEYINFEKFTNDWDCSSTSALNSISYYIFHFKKEEIYLKFHKIFLGFIKPLDSNSLTEDQLSFFNFYYKALLYSRYGKESHRMSFVATEILKSDLVFNI